MAYASSSSGCDEWLIRRVFPIENQGWRWIRRESDSSPVTVIQAYCQIIPEREDSIATDWTMHQEGINALLEFSKHVSERNAAVTTDMLEGRGRH